jgi:hypothetical protein
MKTAKDYKKEYDNLTREFFHLPTMLQKDWFNWLFNILTL